VPRTEAIRHPEGKSCGGLLEEAEKRSKIGSATQCHPRTERQARDGLVRLLGSSLQPCAGLGGARFRGRRYRDSSKPASTKRRVAQAKTTTLRPLDVNGSIGRGDLDVSHERCIEAFGIMDRLTAPWATRGEPHHLVIRKFWIVIIPAGKDTGDRFLDDLEGRSMRALGHTLCPAMQQPGMRVIDRTNGDCIARDDPDFKAVLEEDPHRAVEIGGNTGGGGKNVSTKLVALWARQAPCNIGRNHEARAKA